MIHHPSHSLPPATAGWPTPVQRRLPAIAGRPRRGFTITELLIVISVIIILLSILIVSLNIARKTAQTANTQAVMQSISQGLTRFQDDVGYLPPILDRERRLTEVPDPDDGNYETDVQEWFSLTSLATYLVGYGSYRQDGYGFDPDVSLPQHDAERPASGIRNPGSDGVWGAGTLGDLDDRDPPTTGQVYGPYLELNNPKLFGVIDESTGNGFTIKRPGDQGYQELVDDDAPLVILDFWGQPISYFRRVYPPGALRQSYRAIDRTNDGVSDPVPTLSDFIRLRPYNLGRNDIDATFGDAAGDPSTTFELQSGEFALWSSGPDKASTDDTRVDAPNDFNVDNIVEVGP